MEKNNINRLLLHLLHPNPDCVEVISYDILWSWSVIIITAAIQRGNRISTHGVESPGIFAKLVHADGRKSKQMAKVMVCLLGKNHLRGKTLITDEAYFRRHM